MKEKKVGLYVGVNSVGAVMIQGKDITSLGRFEFSSLEETKDEVLNEDIRWEALINKTLREIGSNAKDIYVSVADRDFIFRPLEMPMMKKKEIRSSLVYEVEKYIPFKMEELVWDYDYVGFSKEKKINLSFVGIKEDNFKRVESILSRLELNAVSLEPSCMSLVRVIKSLKEFSQIKNFAILDFSRSEVYLTFFQHTLPVFNRYLVVPKKENTLDLENFIEAVNFSFQYFKREFKAYRLEKFIIIGDSDLKNLSSLLKEGLQVEIVTIPSSDLVAGDNVRIENVKALGVLGVSHSSYKFKPKLRKNQEHVPSSKKPLKNVALNGGLLGMLVGIGLIISVFLSFMLRGEILEKKNVLKKKEENVFVPAALTNLSWPEMVEIVNLEEKKSNSLKRVLTSFIRLSSFFKELAAQEMIPHGLWIGGLNIYQKKDRYIVALPGYIFRNDDYEEGLGVDEFISNLKKSKVVKSIFSRVELDFSSKEKVRGFEVTHFSITLKE